MKKKRKKNAGKKKKIRKIYLDLKGKSRSIFKIFQGLYAIVKSIRVNFSQDRYISLLKYTLLFGEVCSYSSVLNLNLILQKRLFPKTELRGL
jgi:hypothetical protein